MTYAPSSAARHAVMQSYPLIERTQASGSSAPLNWTNRRHTLRLAQRASRVPSDDAARGDMTFHHRPSPDHCVIADHRSGKDEGTSSDEYVATDGHSIGGPRCRCSPVPPIAAFQRMKIRINDRHICTEQALVTDNHHLGCANARPARTYIRTNVDPRAGAQRTQDNRVVYP